MKEKFRTEKVDAVVNADETLLLFPPLGEKLIAPTGIKCVGMAITVDDEKKRGGRQYSLEIIVLN